MKKYQYIVAAACVLVGAAGFAGIYATNQSQQKQEELVKNQEDTEMDLEEEIQIGANDTEEPNTNQVADNESDTQDSTQQNEGVLAENESENSQIQEQVALVEENESSEAEVGTIQEEVLHFDADDGIMWPVEGNVLLDYSMESTIFFPTLQQYKCNPAMIFSANVNDKVYFIAKGKITAIDTNEETGCTVTQDIGDGYTAIYGQLKELNFDVGDMAEAGQVAGYVSEPTKYYTIEGTNVYFQLLKDGQPIDPKEVLPEVGEEDYTAYP